MQAWRESVGALRERPFRLLWLAQTTSFAGDALIPVAIAFAVLSDLDGSAGDLGIVLAAFMLSRVVFLLAGGVWADRLPRRSVLIGCDVVRGVVEALVAVALLTGSAELWMLVVTQSVFGAAAAFFGPASAGLVPETVSASRLQQANGLLGLSETATSIFGPLVAGVLVALFEPGWVFAVDALTFAGSTSFLLALKLPAWTRPPRQAFLADLAAGWRHVTARVWLWTNLIAASLMNIAIAVFIVLGPVIAESELGGADSWGLVLTGGAAGGVLGGAMALRLRPRRPLVANYLVILPLAVPLLLLVRPFPTVAIAAGAALAFGGVVLGNAIWSTVVQTHVPRDALSRVNSYDIMISILFMPLGLALAGPSAELVGVDATLIAAATLAVAANVALLLIPEVWRIRGPAATDDGEPDATLAQP